MATNKKKSKQIQKKDAVTDDQVKKVVYWILDGESMFDIAEAMTAEFPRKDHRKKLMDAVLAYFVRSGQANTDVVRGWCLESLREIYRKMMDNADHAGAAGVIKSIYRLNDQWRK